MTKLLSYTDKGTWIHRLSGSTKLIFFLLWCVTSAMTYDTRILLIMIAVTVTLFALSKTEWRQISAVFKIVMFFMILNVVAIFIISPYQGCSIYGSKTILTPFLPGHAVTREELFYLFNVVIKYFTVTPAIFIFLVTTDPSEFAASMNTIGIPYTVAYSVAIALRYIPDVQGDYRRIRNAQQARGRLQCYGTARIWQEEKEILVCIPEIPGGGLYRADHQRRILRVGAVVHLPGRQQVLEPMGVRMIGAVILQQMVLRLDV